MAKSTKNKEQLSAYSEWLENFQKSASNDKKFMTTSSRPIKALYVPADTADIDFERDIGYPGEYPYTRGVHASMYRGRVWTMRQFSGFGTPKQTNERYHYLLKDQRTVSLSAEAGPDRAFGRFRSADVNGLRFRFAPFVGRSWRLWRGYRYTGRYGDSL
jgi:hypothetical protein